MAERCARMAVAAALLVAAGACGRHTGVPDSPELREHLELTTQLGREIYRRDRLTWQAGRLLHGTEFDQPVTGWVIDIDHPATDVLFFAELDGELLVNIVVRCQGEDAGGCVAEPVAPPQPLSERNAAQFWAQSSCWSHPEFQRTSEYYNFVAIPAGQGPDADWWVYLIALDPDPNHLVLGQHYRCVVGADGRTAKSFDALAEGGAVIDIGGGTRPLAVSVTHVLDDTPTEMHVYLAYGRALDLIVVTDTHPERRGPPMMWKVDYNGVIVPF